MNKSEKRCFMCGITKPVEQFNKHSRNRDGLTRYCSECVIKAAEYRQAQAQVRNLELFRTCPRCNQSYPSSDYAAPGPKAKCRVCRLEYANLRQKKLQEEREQVFKNLSESSSSPYSSAYDVKQQCNTCGENKHVTAFRFASGGDYTKRVSKCKDCERDASRNAAVLKREKARQERIEASLALSHEERVEQKRRKNLNSHYKAAYGKTIEEYEEMVRIQKGCCAICGKRPSAIGETLVVDHSHVTGSVRGLLCFWCNVGLGWFQDNITSLSQAVEYLKSYQVWEDQDYIENTLSRSSVSLTEAS